jgi:hypothetical protein
MQRIHISLGIFLLALGCWSHTAYGQTPECALRIQETLAGVGETVTIPITLHQAPNTVDAFGFDLSFDPRILRYTGAFRRGDLITDWSFFEISNPDTGILRIGGLTVTDILTPGQSGLLVVLEFQVICSDCDSGDMSRLVPTRLVDDIATWQFCSAPVQVLHCVDGQGLTVGQSSGAAGSIISIPVQIAEPPGALGQVEAFGFHLNFDPQVLRYTGTFRRGDLIADWSFFDVSSPDTGTLRVGGFTVTEAIEPGESGTIVTVEFEVLCTECTDGDKSPIFMTNMVDDIAAWPACPGTFTFGCVHPGDVDENGNVTPHDAMLVFEHFLQLRTLAGCGWIQADMDQDGAVTPVDAIEIFATFLDQ